MKNNNRISRVNEELKRALSTIISFKLKDPDITGMLSVTKVKTTPDLKFAKVYVSILNSKNNKKTMETLNKCKGFIRSEIAKKVNLRITPELSFEYDDSMEYGQKIETIINELNHNKEG